MIVALWAVSGVSNAAIGDRPFISFSTVPRGVPLVEKGRATAMWIDTNEFPAVLRAAGDLRADIEKVSGVAPQLRSDSRAVQGGVALVVGTLGRSALIDDLLQRRKLDVSDIEGKWEAFVIQSVAKPWPGVEQAVVVAGSDRRGTIYGLYEVSQQIGVSPWYWWADVPTTKRDALFVRAGRYANPGPTVQYRGIFLNDEAPALQNWAQEKFGGLDHRFYSHVFELMLRLRANYLWPAMWGNSLFDDDPRSALLAGEYGIVLGTSHHEPMMRAHVEWERYGHGPWDYAKNPATLREFWRAGVERARNNEKIVTVGMRGDGDEAMSEETDVASLTKIVDDQRSILRHVLGKEPAQIPQLWALYKEVQDYYERGMRVPDDVTLLWSDDNWGNIRRLPTQSERNRAGGAGVYYHFDYVGGPRNYKWLNTVPIAKVREQMSLAAAYGADRIWIVNVGDLKPMEFPIEFFLTMAWDPARFAAESLDEYSAAWAAREFGPRHAARIAALINGYTKLNGRRKPEMLAPETLSLVNYREAERVLAEWRELVADAERIDGELAERYRAAFFQLVLYPVKASAGVQALYVAVGRNRLYATQGRTAANVEARKARELFAADAALARDYHRLEGGKWNHMMSQIKLGYITWQQPNAETLPAVSEIKPLEQASMAVALEGSAGSWPSYDPGPARLPPLDCIARGTRWVEIFNRGAPPFEFSVQEDQSWLAISERSGSVEDSRRIEVGVNWDLAPTGKSKAVLTVLASTGERLDIEVPIDKPATLPPKDFDGFVESDGHIAIEAPHYMRLVREGDVTWQTLPDFGRTLGGVTVVPVNATARSLNPRSSRLEYDIYLYTSGELSVSLDLAPSLDFLPGDGLRIAVSLDDAAPQILSLNTWAEENWSRAVSDGIRRLASKHRAERPGAHVLKVWMITPGVVLERIVVDAGGVRESYLGPPPSVRWSERRVRNASG
jgi:hypothetical protein